MPINVFVRRIPTGLAMCGLVFAMALTLVAREQLNGVKVPPEFEVTLFASPPDIRSPTCLTATADGTVFIGIDENGSLSHKPGKGRVVRCRDTDDDGRADQFIVFAEMDSPRGLVYDRRTLYVLHPPKLTAFRDTDGDGVADDSQVLVSGLGGGIEHPRGADHTTNGIQLGMDGWIYIAVGDFGADAKAKDGTRLKLHGGGVIRVRPDGSELELCAQGLRNIYDVAIDPYLNLFTRDNTNDGGGWDVRLSHILPLAHYGYPSLFQNFHDEIMPPLADYGGGSGTGALYVQEPRLPEGYRDALYTCDWGRSRVYWHPLTAHGATFKSEQHEFVRIPKPTDITVDGYSHLYIASWEDGGFNYREEPFGYVIRLTPKQRKPQPEVPDLDEAAAQQLVDLLESPSFRRRWTGQRALLQRKWSSQTVDRVIKLAQKGPLPTRVAAIFTLRQAMGRACYDTLLNLTRDPEVREFALRALANRRSQLDEVPVDAFASALHDANPRVQIQAMFGLARFGYRDAAYQIFKMANLPEAEANSTEMGNRALAHVAFRALVKLHATQGCLEALDNANPDLRPLALRALGYMHNKQAVNGLISRLHRAVDPEFQRGLMSALIRLYHREGEWNGEDWWGTRPDTRGPYYKPVRWKQSDQIGNAVARVMVHADPAMADWLRQELARHRVDLQPLNKPQPKTIAEQPTEQTEVVVPKVQNDDPDLVGNLDYEKVVRKTLKVKGDAGEGEQLFLQQACVACHTTSQDQPLKGPFLGDITDRYSDRELLESILKPNAQVAQGFATAWFELEDGSRLEGFIVRESGDEIELRNIAGVARVIRKKEIDRRGTTDQSMMPEGLVNNLTPDQLSSILAYLSSLN